MCHIENQIAEHCNSDQAEYCYHCENLLTEDDEVTEVHTCNGYKNVCDLCLPEYMEL